MFGKSKEQRELEKAKRRLEEITKNSESFRERLSVEIEILREKEKLDEIAEVLRNPELLKKRMKEKKT